MDNLMCWILGHEFSSDVTSQLEGFIKLYHCQRCHVRFDEAYLKRFKIKYSIDGISSTELKEKDGE